MAPVGQDQRLNAALLVLLILVESGTVQPRGIAVEHDFCADATP